MVQKRSFYEMSSRVPMVVSLPGGEGAGTRCTEPVNLIDLAPTLMQYVYIRNQEGQLVDLESDPGEWSNLCDS